MILSCVIIARNEERNVARCIESVLACTEHIKNREIILVDSCSSDRTVAIAKHYAINIIGLNPSWKLSPSAGRFCGISNVSGTYVFVIDADMEVLKGWIDVAMDFLINNHNVAAVVGRQYDVYYDSFGKQSQPRIGKNSKGQDKLKRIKYVHQSCLFRRASLMKAGNFQPFLKAEEEAEVSYRLRKIGYDLFYLPFDSIFHYSILRDSFQETKRRIKNGLYEGCGDMMKWALQNRYYPLIWDRFKVFLLFIFLIGISFVCSIYFFLTNQLLHFLIFVSSPVIFILFMAIKKKNIHYGLLSALNISIISLELIKGFYRTIPSINYYPKDVVWIKRV